ncbi:MAG: hypothetical protein ABJE95_01960 [Byssovorax sp.]
MSSVATVALLGGPSSGKSTYLGAVIHALETASSSTLTLGVLPDDATAYERLSEPLLRLTYPQRTKGERNVLDLPLLSQRGGLSQEIHLTMGDYDGEEVERLFRDRTRGYSAEWRARASARGLLLFIRPDALTSLPQLTPHELLSDREQLLALKAKGEKKVPAKKRRKAEDDPERAFGGGLKDEARAARVAAPNDAVRVPTVLAVVELLQFLRHERGLAPGERPEPGQLRIALLAAGWDAVDPAWKKKGPSAFFAEQAPLLHDFLWSNYRMADVCHFGLSSTGGDLRKPGYQQQYREDPHGFVSWADATGRLHQTRNLALPIEWALFGDEALGGPDDVIVQS